MNWLKLLLTTKLILEKKQESMIIKQNNFLTRVIDITWGWLLKTANENLVAFIQLASKDSIVNLLYPYLHFIHSTTTIEKLCFSRCTGYPHTMDTPYIIFSTNSQEYEVYSPDNNLLASGDVNKALEILKENLPPNIKRACKGTALDIID